MSKEWKISDIEEIIEEIRDENVEFIIVATTRGISTHAPQDMPLQHIAFHLVLLLDGMQRELEAKRAQAEQN